MAIIIMVDTSIFGVTCFNDVISYYKSGKVPAMRQLSSCICSFFSSKCFHSSTFKELPKLDEAIKNLPVEQEHKKTFH